MVVVFPPLVEELFEEPYLAPHLLKAWAESHDCPLDTWDGNQSYFHWATSPTRLLDLASRIRQGPGEAQIRGALASLGTQLADRREDWRRRSNVRWDIFTACRYVEQAACGILPPALSPPRRQDLAPLSATISSASGPSIWMKLESAVRERSFRDAKIGFPVIDFAAWSDLEQSVEGWEGLDPFIGDVGLDELAHYAIVGFSLAMDIQVIPGLRLARALKRQFPSKSIVLGGALLSMIPEAFLRTLASLPYVDGLCVGEGENVLLEMLGRDRDRRSLLSTPGLTFLRGDDLVTNPPPARVPVPSLPSPRFEPDYLESLPARTSLPVLYARGCYWGKCSFCNFPPFTGIEQPERFAEALEDLVVRYGIRKFSFIGDSLPASFGEKASRAILQRRLDVQWWSYCKIEKTFVAKEHLIPLLAEAGCSKLTIGVETLVNRLLEFVKKGYTWEMVLPQVRRCHELGIRVKMNLIWDLPTSTEGETALSLERARELVPHVDTLSVFTFQLSHGSPFQRNPESFGLTLSDDGANIVAPQGMNPEARRRVYLKVADLEQKVAQARQERLTRRVLDVAQGTKLALHPTAVFLDPPPGAASRPVLFFEGGMPRWAQAPRDFSSSSVTFDSQWLGLVRAWCRQGLVLAVGAAPPPKRFDDGPQPTAGGMKEGVPDEARQAPPQAKADGSNSAFDESVREGRSIHRHHSPFDAIGRNPSVRQPVRVPT